MAAPDLENRRISPSQEYSTLREELNQSRKYVFERPLVIVGVGFALLTTEGSQYGAIIPAMMAGLLLFNFWFTINRLLSTSRIVAYIQVVLEGDAEWRGWETSLREYRIWLNTDPEVKRQTVKRELEKNAIPDATSYYLPIYQLHIVLFALCTVASILQMINQPTPKEILATTVLVVLTCVFISNCWRWRPSQIRPLIERNVVIWKHALRMNGCQDPDLVEQAGGKQE